MLSLGMGLVPEMTGGMSRKETMRTLLLNMHPYLYYLCIYATSDGGEQEKEELKQK